MLVFVHLPIARGVLRALLTSPCFFTDRTISEFGFYYFVEKTTPPNSRFFLFFTFLGEETMSSK